jgi:PAS domain S-box-containing protein
VIGRYRSNGSTHKFSLQRLASWSAFALSLILFLSNLTFAAEAQEGRAKRVLIISTGSRLAPGFVIVDQQLLQALGKIPSPIETYAENIDVVRFPDQGVQRIFSEYLSAKYADYPPDLIVLVFVGNLGIPGKLLRELFPRTPIIVAGLTEEELRSDQFGKRVSGIAQRVDPRASLEMILRLQPDVRRVVVIGGTAEIDRNLFARVKEAARSFTAAMEIDFWDNLSMAELRQAVAALPPQTAILFGRMFRDAAGQAVISSQVGQSIAQWANAPVYTMSDASLGTGAVGGSVASIQAFGRRAGELARLVLTGTVIESLPFEIRSDTVPMFDWRALQRWGIPESRLPPGSVVRFKPPSMWQQYRWYIVAAILIMALQAAMIADLLLQRARRRRAEAGLLESRQFMELAAEAGGTGLWVRDLMRGDLWANPRMRSLLGVAREEPLGIDAVLGRVHPDDRARVLSIVESAQETGMPFDVAYRITAFGDTPERWVAVKGQTVRSPPGQPLRRMGTMIDITERKRAEEKLRESEENFRRLVETTAAVIWEADIDSWVFTYVGPQAVKLLGYPLEQWYEKDFWASHIHPEDRERAVETCTAMSKAAEQFEFDYRMLSASGGIVWIHDIVNCTHQGGRPKKLRGLMLDITERKHGEQALQESEARFRTVADAAPVMIWMAGNDKLCTFFNKGWCDFTGRRLEQELGNGWAESVHPDDMARCLDIYHRYFDAREEFTMELRLRRYDGEYRWVLDHGVPRFDPEGTFLGYIGSCIDVTERKQAEESLQKERRFLRQVIDTDPNFIFAKDRSGRFTLANQAVADAYGTTVDDLIGKTDADFNRNRQEVEFFRRVDREVIDTLQERFIPEEHITDARGKIHWVQTVKRPIIDSDGSAKQVLGASTDITQRKETELELRRQRAELAHVARVSLMGELAASLAHELNQPLTAILSNAQAALRFMSGKQVDLEEVREILEDIVKDNSRAGEVIRRMRALVKKEELEFQTLDLRSLIADVVLLVHSDAVLQNVRISLDLPDSLPSIQGDRVQLQQVLLNLLLNAFDAMKDGRLSDRNVKLQGVHQDAHAILVSVRDSGPGLTVDKLAKIFQPFFTTKGEGLGMGLSICRSIIEAHGGRLWAENNPDRGATFYFTLPVARAADEQGLSNRPA